MILKDFLIKYVSIFNSLKLVGCNYENTTIPINLMFIIICNLYLYFTGGGSVPKDPIDLSFWVAQNILVNHEERLTLLSYDCAISRLQKEIKYLMEVRIKYYYIYIYLTKKSNVRILFF
jgi:hypothetical protein